MNKNEKIFLLLLLSYYLLMALLFVFKVPAFEAPDEIFHLRYANFVAKNLELPNQYDPKKYIKCEGHQHPLYYIIVGLTIRTLDGDNEVRFRTVTNKKHAWNGGGFHFVPYFNHPDNSIFHTPNDTFTFYFLRILSVFFGLVNVIFLYFLAALMLPDNCWRKFAVVLAVTIPQFLFNNAYISNDSLANLLATISVFFIFKIVKKPENFKNYLLLGISLGLGFLTKKTVLFLFPVLIAVLALQLFKAKNRKKRTEVLKYCMILFLIFIIISGFLLVRNYSLYGELLGSEMEMTTLAKLNLVKEKSLLSDYFTKSFFPVLFKSFIGVFGWMNLYVPLYIYDFYLYFFLLCLVGIVFYLHKEKNYFKDIGLNISLALFFFCLEGVIVYNLTYSQNQGRFLFPVMGLIVILVGKGMTGLFSKFSNRVNWMLCGLITALLVSFDLISIKRLIAFYNNINHYNK